MGPGVRSRTGAPRVGAQRRVRVWWRAGLVGLLSVGPVLAGGGAASGVDGQWWYAQMGVAAAHAAGADGHGVVVAMIDSNINPALEVFAGADLQVHEPSLCLIRGTDQHPPAASSLMTFSTFHGTATASLIVGNGRGQDGGPSTRGIAPRATLRFYSAGRPKEDHRSNGCSIAFPMLQAVSDGAKIITTSRSGRGGTVREAAAWALNQGVIIVAGLPEASGDEIYGSVGELNGAIGVQMTGPDHRAVPQQGPAGGAYPNKKVTVGAPGLDILLPGDLKAKDWAVTSQRTGTSYATPITAGVLAAVWSKYPSATANQLVQSLIANATPGGPELGYGLVNLPAMVADDPTKYPDVNLLIVPDAQFDGDISAADIAAATEPPFPIPTPPVTQTATSSPSPTPTDLVPPEPPGGVPGWVWAALAGVVLVVITVVILAAVLITRKAKS